VQVEAVFEVDMEQSSIPFEPSYSILNSAISVEADRRYTPIGTKIIAMRKYMLIRPLIFNFGCQSSNRCCLKAESVKKRMCG
jgi:hypothetical protein